jgi:digeranylgeranylglycerophospholipid reductase
MSFDVVIVGAGPAGVTAAVHIAKAGNSVLLIDKAEEKEIGYRTGDGVVKIDTFSGSGFPRAQGDELIAFLDTFNVYSPTGKTKKVVNHSAMIVDRLIMNQRLLTYAREAGVTIKGSTELQSVNLDGGTVVGITSTAGESFEAKLVIDASGINGTVRKHLPDSFHVEKEINPKHIARAYVELLSEPENSTEISSYLAVNNGYVWKTPTEVGFGSFDHSLDLKKILHEFVDKHMHISSDSSHTSYGEIAVRQNLYNMVGNGFLAVGDAACMVSPIDGAGITTSMIGAKIAAETVNECLAKNDVSQQCLWKFNLRYNKSQGANLAYMDMLRRGLIGLSADDIDFAFEKEIVTNKDVLDSITGEIANVSAIDKAQRAFRGLRRPGILLRMENCMNKSKDLKAHYMHYPASIDELMPWVKKLNQINESFT